jgi:RNA polymerase sigma-70 factor (ECF subfamily)
VLASDGELLEQARAGDEKAFSTLVARHHTALVRVASTFVRSRAEAEDVAQDTWLGVLRGLQRFEGRSSFRTWLFAILGNRARTTAYKERRAGPAVDPDRFGADGAWSEPPQPWTDDVDARLDAAALAPLVRAAIDELPDAQRQVITLRDVEGVDSATVRRLLGVSEGNQRVLLHRARSKVRASVEREVPQR